MAALAPEVKKIGQIFVAYVAAAQKVVAVEKLLACGSLIVSMDSHGIRVMKPSEEEGRSDEGIRTSEVEEMHAKMEGERIADTVREQLNASSQMMKLTEEALDAVIAAKETFSRSFEEITTLEPIGSPTQKGSSRSSKSSSSKSDKILSDLTEEIAMRTRVRACAL